MLNIVRQIVNIAVWFTLLGGSTRANYWLVKTENRSLCHLFDIADESSSYLNLSEVGRCIGAVDSEKDGEWLISQNRIQVFANKSFVHLNSTRFNLNNPTKKKGNTYYVSKDFLTALYPLITDQSVALELVATAKPKAVKCIVLDPGHGGQDLGARSTVYVEAVEKRFTLAIANSILPLLGKKMGARIIMTRYSDRFVSLYDRVELANQSKCDLLISVHINASSDEGVAGMETYFLSTEAIDKYTGEIARLENQHIRYFNDIPKTMDEKVQSILHDLAVKDFIVDSSRLAEIMQKNLRAQTSFSDRGIRQAPFYILSRGQMPSILMELGFISNQTDTQFLKRELNLEKIGTAILQSLGTFDLLLAQKRGVGG